MGLIAGGISAASGLMGMFGGSGDQPQAPTTYQYANSAGADQNAYNQIGQLGQYNTYGQSLPQYSQITQNALNNPYAGQYQQASNSASQLGMGTGLNQIGTGQQVSQSGLAMLPYAQQILGQGYDTNGQIYNTQQQLNTDQTRAGLAARGMVSSPYGAGVENQSNMLFNQNWQNNLLNRQSTAAGAASQLNNAATASTNAGSGMMTSGLNNYGTATALPYNASQAITNNQYGALNQYGAAGQSAGNMANMSISDYLQYLTGGNSANNTAVSNYTAQNNAQNQQFNQQQAIGKNIGSGISGLGQSWNSGNNLLSGYV